jgi:hypothetical protein
VTNAAVAAAGPCTEKFFVTLGRYFGYFVVAIAAVLIVWGLASQGTGALGFDAICVAFALLAWVVLIRPEVTAHRNGLLLRNMLRDTFLPWSCIKSCRVSQTLQVGTRDKVYHGLGVSRSARQAMRETRQGRRGTPIGPTTGATGLQFPPRSDLDKSNTEVHTAMQEHVIKNNFTHTEQRIETLIRERSSSTADQSPKVVWDPMPVIALVVAAGCIALAFFV